MLEAKHGALVDFLDADAKTVLIKARDYIHRGAKLLSHPLSGVAPGVSPYKSLVIEPTESGKTDFASLGLIEDAIRQCKKAPEGFSGHDENTLEDFMIVDLDILDSSIPRR